VAGSLAEDARRAAPAAISPALRVAARWLWIAWLIGALLRIVFVLSSEGTLDVPVWEAHARSISERGLAATYRGGIYTFNHPPLAGLLESWLWNLCQATGLPYRVALRAPTALLDACTAWMLFQLLGSCRSARLRDARHLLAALYWISPLAILFSAQHGNTDTAVATSLLGALLLSVRGRIALAGAVFGLGLAIKIPGLLALPALLLALPDWRARLRFAAAAFGVAFFAYLPGLWQDAAALGRAVFLYPGLRIQTTSGTQIWGLPIFLPQIAELLPGARGALRSFATLQRELNTWVCVGSIAIFAWSRRRERDPEAVAFSLAGSFAILYGLTSQWAFQYLAWSLPFWMLAGWRLGFGAALVSSAYVYFLYAWLCGDWLLLGAWDFVGKPDWPLPIRLLRNVASLYFLVAALSLLVGGVRHELARWRSASSVG
jgi:hypothetical protein